MGCRWADKQVTSADLPVQGVFSVQAQPLSSKAVLSPPGVACFSALNA